jgi:hypothetical protein
MAEGLITQSNDFDVQATKYGKPVINKRGGKNIKVLDKNGNGLSINYPLMLTWGINAIKDPDTDELKGYDMAVQFQDHDSTEVSIFREKMQAFEEKLLSDGITNCKEWFNKAKMSREVAEELMNPMFRYPKDRETKVVQKDKNPTLRFKVPFWDGKFTSTEVYDLDKAPVFTPKGDWDKTPPQLVPKGCWTAGIIQCGGIYFANGKFGVTWQLLQVVVRPPVRIQGTCFVQLSEESKNKVQQLNQEDEEADNNETQKQKPNTYVSDDEVESENDDESESEKEREPTPPPAPVKRKVVRKKTT